VGAFIILSEGSAAAGVRRIEAVTGRGAYELIARRFKLLKQAAAQLKSGLDEVPQKTGELVEEMAAVRKQVTSLKTEKALDDFTVKLENPEKIGTVQLVTANLPGTDKETLGKLADSFRQKYPQTGVCVIGTVSPEGQVIVMAAVTQDLIKKGIKAGDLVGHVSRQLGAGGGGAPHLAYGGGRDATKLPDALASVKDWIAEKNK
jgi:alanyl-tRNA synthetase